MKQVSYGKEKFDLTEEEFESFIKSIESGNRIIRVPRLNVYLSPSFIWAGEKPNNSDEMILHDGEIAVRKFGIWTDKFSGARLDPIYYPEIAKDCNSNNTFVAIDKKL